MPITLHLPEKKTTTAREEIELRRLERVLTPEWLKEYLIPVITQRSRVSIRVMDWLVTNYSKEHKITYTYKKGKVQRIFDVHHEYKSTLDSLGRPLFDPFRRQDRLTFAVEETQKDEHGNSIAKEVTYQSTLGQLTFWHWAQTKGVFRFCYDNAEKIEKHMTMALFLRDKKKKSSKGKRKRSSLTRAPPVKCFIFPVAMVTNFNDN